jgi:hypothetical protein
VVQWVYLLVPYGPLCIHFRSCAINNFSGKLVHAWGGGGKPSTLIPRRISTKTAVDMRVLPCVSARSSADLYSGRIMDSLLALGSVILAFLFFFFFFSFWFRPFFRGRVSSFSLSPHV